MGRKKVQTQEQLQFDLGEARLPPVPVAKTGKALARRKADSPPKVEVLPPAIASVQPIIEPRSPAQRETEAFQLYQSQQRYTTTVFTMAALFGLGLLAVQFFGAVVPEATPGGFKVVFENKRAIAGLLGWVTLGTSLWALYNLHCTWALWRKCGFFFQEIMQPSDKAWVRFLVRSVMFIIVGSIILIVVIVIGYSLPDMVAVIGIAWDKIMSLPSGTWEPIIKYN